jgi:hypothetical protein
MFKGLQKYAAAGGALWTTARLYSDWGLVVGLLVGASTAGLGLWEWGTQYGYTPIVVAGLLTAVATIWVIIGARALWLRGTPSTPKMSFDYAYGLALVGMHFGKDDADEASHIQLGVVWKCAGPAALKYHIDHFRVVIGDRTTDGFFEREGTISRDCHLTFFYPSFSKAQLSGLGAKVRGVVEYRVRYGHPEHGLLRVVTARLNTTIRLDDKAGVVYLIESITDEEIKT